MAERRQQSYSPPPLDHRIIIRNPADRPTPVQDRFGNVTQATWGVPVWAGRTDRAPYTVTEEGVPVHTSVTIWHIRKRPSVAPDVEVVFGDKVYISAGEPAERGGPAAGRRERYLLIYTTLRQ